MSNRLKLKANRLKLKAVLSVTVVVLFVLAIASFVPNSRAEVVIPPPLIGAFVPNEILIGLKPEVAQNLSKVNVFSDNLDIASFDQLNEAYRVESVAKLFADLDQTNTLAVTHGLTSVVKLTVPLGTDIFAMIADYQADANVLYAEPNRIYVATEIPDDADFGEQWALNNTGQTGGTADADIDVPEAWEIETGNADVLIAIIDTGVDYTHEDLSGGRVRTDIDKDFVNGDDDAMDDHGHGTYVAGIAAADTNNEIGIAGICQGCQILPVKVLDSKGSGSAASVAQGIQYAADQGAQIISMSLGFPSNCGCSQTVANAINYAYERGSLLIAASGNDGDKERLSYPAASPRVMSVGASDHNDQEASFSNRSSFLDIMAPGKDIYSLDPDNGYRTASGTSAAAPHVSGVAGLVLSVEPNLGNAALWWRLYQTADNFPGTTNSVATSSAEITALGGLNPSEMPYQIYLPSAANLRSTFGRLNAHRAVKTSITGEMHAPIDTCNSEPSGCVPGCGAEVVLVGDDNVLEGLQLLRNFRDNVLIASPIGQEWIALYEANRLDVALMLVTDSQLREQTRSAINLWLPLLEALVSSDAEEDAILTQAHLDTAAALLVGFTTNANSQLAAALEEANKLLQTGQQYVGMDIREAWSSFQTSLGQ